MSESWMERVEAEDARNLVRAGTSSIGLPRMTKLAREMAEDAEATRLLRWLCQEHDMAPRFRFFNGQWIAWDHEDGEGRGPTLLAALQALAEAVKE